jgi:tRNA (adenine37-N6)-methyltransferase
MCPHAIREKLAWQARSRIISVMSDTPEDQELTLRPIGYIRCGKAVKFAALHQPDESAAEQNVLELLPQEDLRRGLQDLQGFTRIWLIWWFHRNETWRPLVLPPRGTAKRRGVFATRSPHRPNALGMTPVKLLGIDGNRLLLGPCDLVDGTPVFDIKPYIPEYDVFAEESSGWLEEVDAWQQQEAKFSVRYGALALAQIEWLRRERGIDFTARIEEILAHDPSPHRTRRVRHKGGGLHEIGCGAWRVRFRVHDSIVSLEQIVPGFPLRLLQGEHCDEVPDREAQLAFLLQWRDALP